MLTRNITSTKEIPNEPGQQMTFRQLGWRQLAEAEELRSATVLRNLKAMGGEMLRELQTVNRPAVEAEAATETTQDPLTKYDQASILRAGIAAWSYPDKLTPDAIDSLDEATARWAALEIIQMGMPPIEKETESRFLLSPTSSTVSQASPATATIAVGAMVNSQPNGSSA